MNMPSGSKPLPRQSALALGGVAILFALVYLFMPEHLGGLAPLVKALPIWILAGLAFMAKGVPLHRHLALALALSGFGDLFLSLSFANNFAAGMGAFLLAQLAYISNFWSRRRPMTKVAVMEKILLAAVMVWVIGMGYWVVPKAGSIAPALVVYFSALTLMVLLSVLSTAPRIAVAGALLFLLSDSLIGLDRFVTPLPERHLAVMSSYYLAQALLFWGLKQKKV